MEDLEKDVKTILVVDDEQPIIDILVCNLKKEGYRTIEANDGVTAVNMALEQRPDLILLDIMLPKLDGLSVCKRIKNTYNVPILMLTARDSIDDRVNGLGVGADDYLIKPFSLRELNARVQALIRRAYGDNTMKLKVGDLVFDLSTTQVCRGGKPIKLNPTGLTILKELMLRSPAIVSRNRLEAQVWGGGAPDSDSLRANIYLLRQAIDKAYDKKLIHTHPGLGWSINE